VPARPEGHSHPQLAAYFFFWETGFGFLLEFLLGQFLFLFFRNAACGIAAAIKRQDRSN